MSKWEIKSNETCESRSSVISEFQNDKSETILFNINFDYLATKWVCSEAGNVLISSKLIQLAVSRSGGCRWVVGWGRTREGVAHWPNDPYGHPWRASRAGMKPRPVAIRWAEHACECASSSGGGGGPRPSSPRQWVPWTWMLWARLPVAGGFRFRHTRPT